MTEESKIFQAILTEHFLPLIDKHGNTHEAVNWGSLNGQKLRFKVLLDPFLAAQQSFSLLDVGCGLGHMLDYIVERGINFNYHGIDVVDEMVEQARQHHPEKSMLFENTRIEDSRVEKHDIVIASGIFFLACDKKRMQDLITRLFSLCKVGIAFNSLSTKSTTKDPSEFYADPAEVLDFCLKITPRCILRHDYLPNDFTVHMFREFTN
ncbi:class I SAM-dependent methyltransferase [bacterium]|nr:class I SAM-dependent methyltransferase [bacterium]QQR59911.1 MAG: class I SAM-dependent methyltransferase [Candidatus Melainabacteria bacterium]